MYSCDSSNEAHVLECIALPGRVNETFTVNKTFYKMNISVSMTEIVKLCVILQLLGSTMRSTNYLDEIIKDIQWIIMQYIHTVFVYIFHSNKT